MLALGTLQLAQPLGERLRRRLDLGHVAQELIDDPLEAKRVIAMNPLIDVRGRRIATGLECGQPRLEPRTLRHERCDIRRSVRGRIGHSCLRWSSGAGHPGYGPGSPARSRAATSAAT